MATQSVNSNELLESAREQERQGNLSQAEELYLMTIKADALKLEAYTRLMIVYRKQKLYKKELAIINKAIKTYEGAIKAEQQGRAQANRKAARLSKTLAEHLGLVDKNGLPVYEDKAVAGWRKRKQMVSHKLAKG